MEPFTIDEHCDLSLQPFVLPQLFRVIRSAFMIPPNNQQSIFDSSLGDCCSVSFGPCLCSGNLVGFFGCCQYMNWCCVYVNMCCIYVFYFTFPINIQTRLVSKNIQTGQLTSRFIFFKRTYIKPSLSQTESKQVFQFLRENSMICRVLQSDICR